MKIYRKEKKKKKYKKNLISKKATTFLITALLIVTVFSFPMRLSADDNFWWDIDWQYRKQITINHTMVQNNLTNFPMLITLPYDNDLKQHAQNNGNDIVFTDNSGTKLSHEIELFKPNTGQLITWVKIPTLSSTTDTILYLYYGNGICINQQDILGTWESNFIMVHHLNETYSTVADHYKDSTTHDHHGTLVGGNGENNVSGIIGTGLNFDGSNTKLTLLDSNDFTTSNSATRTYEAWVKLSAPTTGYRNIIGDYSGPCFQFHDNQLNYYAGTEIKSSPLNWTTGTWYHIICAVNGITNTTWYRNGVAVSTLTGYYQGYKDPDKFWIGANEGVEYFNGVIDEVRLSSTIRSQGWIQTSYTNQNSPESFYSIGGEETSSPQYYLNVSVVGSGVVTKNPDQPSYNLDQVVTLTATPAIGWIFDHWSGNLTGNENPVTITMDGNKTITANFTQIHYNLTTTIEGQGTVTKNPDQSWYIFGQVVNLTANPSDGWFFSHWSGDLNGSINPTTIIMNGNKSVIVNFTQNQYTLTINLQGQGTVVKNPNYAAYEYGTDVTLIAYPSTGWVFNQWGGDLSGNTNPVTITMDGNKTITANFTQIHYNLTTTIQGQGTVTKNPDQSWYTYEQIVTLTANPMSGWIFDHWSGSLTGSINPTNIMMNANKTVTATFIMQPDNVSMNNYTFIAPIYADSGIGTLDNPYKNCLYNAFNNMTFYNLGAIYFPTGYYLETKKIVLDGNSNIPKHLRIYGDGFWNSEIRMDDNFDDSLIIAKNKFSIYIEGVTLNGNRDYQQVAKPIIDIQYAFDYTIRDTFITYSSGDGIQIGSSTHQAWSGDIINCPIEYCNRNAINITSSANLIIDSCTLAHNLGYNINIGNERPTIINNYIQNEFNDSIRFGPDSGGRIENNRFRDFTKNHNAFVFDSGISNSPSDVLIQGNQIEGNVGLKHLSGNYRNLVIIGNTFNCNTPISLPFQMKSGYIINNIGLNPIGKYAYPFYDNTIGLQSSSQTTPTANQNYKVQIASCRIISTGGTGVNINIYDGHGNLIKNEGATCDVDMEVGWIINFGDFSATPTVSVFFE